AEAELERLAESIADFGLLQPIVVRPPKDGKYELVMGERRLRAAQLAGLDVIPAIVRETADEDMLRDALLENIHRVQLNPLEQAAAYQQLMRDFGVTQEELAKRLKVSRSQISNTLRLLALPAGAQRRVAAGVLSAGHARALLALDTPEEMEDLAKRIVAEGLSVRSVEELISLRKFDKKRQRTRKMKTVLPETAELQDALEEVLETRVRISGTSRGRIVIDYSGAEDLHRIAELIIKSS
ncbi:MAG: ParB/RepB/Spo0J family partition protein, partial [Propionibacteriaceae bacterium]|nr:ParB/RepB/Spo0J family partition protein [Propionibacteriaceae bacterium]